MDLFEPSPSQHLPVELLISTALFLPTPKQGGFLTWKQVPLTSPDTGR